MDVPVLNADGSLHFFIDLNMYRKFLKAFATEELNKFVTAIDGAFERQDWNDLRMQAHSLKGSSGYIGAQCCKEISEQLQYACQAQPLDRQLIENLVRKIREEAELLREAADDYLNGRPLRVPIRNSDQNSPQDSGRRSTQRPQPIQTGRNSSGSEETQGVMKKLKPLMRVVHFDPNTIQFDEEEEVDPYAEINKQWKCLLL